MSQAYQGIYLNEARNYSGSLIIQIRTVFGDKNSLLNQVVSITKDDSILVEKITDFTNESTVRISHSVDRDIVIYCVINTNKMHFYFLIYFNELSCTCFE